MNEELEFPFGDALSIAALAVWFYRDKTHIQDPTFVGWHFGRHFTGYHMAHPSSTYLNWWLKDYATRELELDPARR